MGSCKGCGAPDDQGCRKGCPEVAAASAEYWKFVIETAKEVDSWPDWMKGVGLRRRGGNKRNPPRL